VVVIGLGILLVGLIAFLTLFIRSKPSVVWVPSASVMASGPPSKLALAKTKFLNATSALWRPFRRKARMVKINVSTPRFVEDPTAAGFGVPVATNGNGAKAWVIDAERLKRFVPPMDAPGVGGPRLLVLDGGRAVFPLGPFSEASHGLVNIFFSVAPKIVSGSIRLQFEASWGAAGSFGTSSNIVACVSHIPEGSGLVLECVGSNNFTGRDLWFVLEPTTRVPTVPMPAAKAFTTAPRHADK
jgi:hypothetical protein